MGCLDDILSEAKVTDDPVDFFECVLKINQLYFDGICDSEREKDLEKSDKLWSEQNRVLKTLLDVGRDAAIVARDKDSQCLGGLRKRLFSVSDELKRHCRNSEPKDRYLSKLRSYTDAFYSHMDEFVRLSGGFDTVVCISSGGFEPTLSIAYFMANDTLTVRYSRIVERDNKVVVPPNAPQDYAMEKIKDKRVLVVDDIISTGITMSSVLEYVSRFKPKSLYGVSVRSFVRDLKPSADVKILELKKGPLDLDSTLFFEYIRELPHTVYGRKGPDIPE